MSDEHVLASARSRLDTAWKSEELAEKFLKGIRGGVPFAGSQIEVMIRVIAAGDLRVRRFIDLGCGDGILADAILAKWPAAKGWLVDFSEKMIEEGHKRFDESDSDVSFHLEDLSSDAWFKDLEEHGPFDAIVSGYAIHHQPDDRKRELYREIFHLLEHGGTFINIEHVASPSVALSKINDELFVDSLVDFHEKSDTGLERDEIAEQYYYRDDKHTNQLAFVDQQCDWLREIGYTDVDCYFKVFELAVFGGRRPS